jgi:GDP-D-mannose dehydratase
LDELEKATGKTVETEIDPRFVRPNDIMKIVGDNSRIKADLDWEPEYALSQTIEDFVKSQEK